MGCTIRFKVQALRAQDKKHTVSRTPLRERRSSDKNRTISTRSRLGLGAHDLFDRHNRRSRLGFLVSSLKQCPFLYV